MAALAQCLDASIRATVAACDTTISPAPWPVLVATSALLLQNLAALKLQLDDPGFAPHR